ncbi:MAG: ankyrin repeat domain-containing protein [Alphaproteobacteria bacterium]|nr:ankyrin repeat domain-containing protein [Alphaproteobacteria bacterium]
MMDEKIEDHIRSVRKKIIKTTLTVATSAVVGGLVGNKIAVENTQGDESEARIENCLKNRKLKNVEQAELDEALFKAVKNADLESVKSLLEQGASIDAQNSKGMTPIMVAVNEFNHIYTNFDKSNKFHELSMYLISQNANLLIKDNDGATVGHYAKYQPSSGGLLRDTRKYIHRENMEDLRQVIQKTSNKQTQMQTYVAAARNNTYHL